MAEKLLIMGAGHQGLAMAAHLSANGVECSLWNRTESHIKEIKESGVIRCSGLLEGSIKILEVSEDLVKVLQKVIMVAAPSSAHRDIARLLAKYVDSSYVIILNPGRTFGALEFVKTLAQNGCRSLPLVAETQTILYTCRRDTCSSVRLYALKDGIKIAALNPADTKKVIACLPKCIRSRFLPAASYIETSIGNVGMVLHCAPVLMNIGWIENKKVGFEYYYDGISPSIAEVLESLDEERQRVGEKMGFKIESLSHWLIRTYSAYGNNLFEQLQNNPYYRGIDAPLTIHHRYIEEDVPNGLVPLESAGKYWGVHTPIASTIIDFANIVMKTDYRRTGRGYIDLVRSTTEKRELS